MKLTREQQQALLGWVGEGLGTTDINRRAAKFDPPFEVNRGLVRYYRDRTQTNLKEIQAKVDQQALEEGYSNRETRIAKLSRLAKIMERDLVEDELMWLDQVKSIRDGNDYRVVEYQEFNGAEVTQYRGVLDDIAKELGQRKQETHGTLTLSVDGVRRALEIIYGSDNNDQSDS